MTEVCGVGVNYRALVGGSDLGWATRIPCAVIGQPTAGVVACCEKREYPTLEDATATVDEHERRITGTMIALGTARKDADAKGIKRGHGGASECPCPVCNGVLRYSVAGVNGHLWGKCETDGCVQWMQ